MSAEAWIAWAIAAAIAVGALVVAILAWRRPKAPPEPATLPPDLMLEQVGNLGSSGGKTQYVKAKLRVVNVGQGVARNWQVSIYGGAPLKVGRSPYRGPTQFGEHISWNQDATSGEIPFDQGRELPDWLWIETSGDVDSESLPIEVFAEGMDMKMGRLRVTFPSSGQASLRFDIKHRSPY